eukprot:tig00000870_g5139.t1
MKGGFLASGAASWKRTVKNSKRDGGGGTTRRQQLLHTGSFSALTQAANEKIGALQERIAAAEDGDAGSDVSYESDFEGDGRRRRRAGSEPDVDQIRAQFEDDFADIREALVKANKLNTEHEPLEAGETTWGTVLVGRSRLYKAVLTEEGAVTIELSCTSGEADLYASCTQQYPCRERHAWRATDAGGNKRISIDAADPALVAGPIYISVFGFKAADYDLTLHASAHQTICELRAERGTVRPDRPKYYRFRLADKWCDLVFRLANDKGDVDLFVSTERKRPSAGHREWALQRDAAGVLMIRNTDEAFKLGWYYLCVACRHAEPADYMLLVKTRKVRILPGQTTQATYTDRMLERRRRAEDAKRREGRDGAGIRERVKLMERRLRTLEAEQRAQDLARENERQRAEMREKAASAAMRRRLSESSLPAAGSQPASGAASPSPSPSPSPAPACPARSPSPSAPAPGPFRAFRSPSPASSSALAEPAPSARAASASPSRRPASAPLGRDPQDVQTALKSIAALLNRHVPPPSSASSSSLEPALATPPASSRLLQPRPGPARTPLRLPSRAAGPAPTAGRPPRSPAPGPPARPAWAPASASGSAPPRPPGRARLLRGAFTRRLRRRLRALALPSPSPSPAAPHAAAGARRASLSPSPDAAVAPAARPRSPAGLAVGPLSAIRARRMSSPAPLGGAGGGM